MKKHSKILLVSILNNILVAILKLIGGLIGKSKTLLADGIHSLSDMINDLILFIGTLMSSKPADKEHPFGHGKIENIFSLGAGVVIIFIGIFIMKNQAEATNSTPEKWTCIISAIVIILKFFVSKLLIKKGKEYSSSILLASGAESKIDVISSSFVLVIVILSNFQNQIPILKHVDTLGSMIISLFVVYTGINIIEKETNELIGKKEANKIVENKITQIIKDKNLSIEKIDLIKFGNKYFPIIEILAPSNLTLEETKPIRKSLEEKIKQEDNLINTKIIIKPKEDINAGIARSRNSTKKTRTKNNRKNNQRHKHNS